VQQQDCQAWQKGLTGQLPVKEKSITRKQRCLYYFIVETPDDKVYIRQRNNKDIWAGLYEFILFETPKPVWPSAILESEFARQLFEGQALTARYISRTYQQELTHQSLQGQFITVRLDRPLSGLGDYLLVPKNRLKEYAFPKFINAWLQDPTPAQSLF
jgi:A/G-specific adenine glycosylase